MSWPETVTVGVDREGASKEAVALGTSIARAANAQLELVHVIEQTRRPWHRSVNLTEKQAEAVGRIAMEMSLGQIPDHAELRIRQGHPVEALAEEASELLVLGRHTEGFFDAFVGGTAQKVLHYAACPVLIHKTDATECPKRLVLSTDMSRASRAAMQFAYSWAKTFEGSVTIVHAFDPPSFAYEPTEVDMPHYAVDTIRDEDFADARAFVEKFDWGDVPHELVLEEGFPRHVVQDVAEGVDADLIVIGTHGRTGLGKLIMGSVATKVVEESTRSLLVIPPGATGD